MLTSPDRLDLAEDAPSAGIAACLNKPIRQNELLEAIPMNIVQAPQAEPLPDGLPPKAPTRALRILMAEDNPIDQRVCALILTRSGHAVTTAANGREVVEALGRCPFDLVLMDLQMPVLDGFQATAAIRSAEAGTSGHVPIVALTAHAMKKDQDRCLAAGMDGFVTKPIREGDLLRAIEECLTRGRQAPAIGDGWGEVGRSPDPMDLRTALDRVDGDRGFLGEMIAMFLEVSPGLIGRARDALEAGDAASLVAPAHELKNWAGNFVAGATFAELARLEALGRSGRLEAALAAFPGLEIELTRLTRALARFDSGPVPRGVDDALPPDGDGHRSPSCTP